MTASRSLCGLRLVSGYLDRPSQEALLGALGTVFAAAPLYTPRMPKRYPAHAQKIPRACPKAERRSRCA